MNVKFLNIISLLIVIGFSAIPTLAMENPSLLLTLEEARARIRYNGDLVIFEARDKEVDCRYVVLEANTAKQSETIKLLLENAGVELSVPLDVDHRTLELIATGLEKKIKDLDSDAQIKATLAILRGKDSEAIRNFTLAAHYLDIQPLLTGAIDAYLKDFLYADLQKLTDWALAQDQGAYEIYKKSLERGIVNADLRKIIVSRCIKQYLTRQINLLLSVGAPVFLAEFSPVGEHVITVSGPNHILHRWSSKKEEGVWSTDVAASTHLYNNVSSMTFSRNCNYTFLAGGNQGNLFGDVRSGNTNRLTSFLNNAPVNSVALNPDATRCLTGSSDGVVYLWTIDGSRQHLAIATFAHNAEATCVAFSPDDTKIMTASLDGTAFLWKNEGGKQPYPIATFNHGSPITSSVFSPDGKFILTSGRNGTVKLWESQPGEFEIPCDSWQHGSARVCIAFSPDSKYILTGSSDENTVKLWRRGAAVPLAYWLCGGPVNAVSFSPDGNRFLFGSNDRVSIYHHLDEDSLSLSVLQVILYAQKKNITSRLGLPGFLQSVLDGNSNAEAFLFGNLTRPKKLDRYCPSSCSLQ